MIGVAVVGAGHWGPNLIRNFHEHRLSQITWVVDRDASRLDVVRERFPVARVTGDITEVLEDPETHAVVIATPTSTHFELARAALDAGKHVMVEKPITTDVEEGEELCDLASSKDLVLMVGHVFLFNAGVTHVKSQIDSGTLGRIYYISMVRTNLGPIRPDVNAAWDLASHDISIANYWLESGPARVSASGGNWINPGIEDAVFATLRYPEDVLVNLHVSWLNPRKARDITIVGDRSMLTLDDMNLSEPVRIYDKGVTAEPTASFVDTFASFRASIREGDITVPRVALGEPLRSECDHFIECIDEGKAPLADGPSGVAVVRVLEAMQRSMTEGGAEVEL